MDIKILVALLYHFNREFHNDIIMVAREKNASVNEISHKTSPEMYEFLTFPMYYLNGT